MTVLQYRGFELFEGYSSTGEPPVNMTFSGASIHSVQSMDEAKALIDENPKWLRVAVVEAKIEDAHTQLKELKEEFHRSPEAGVRQLISEDIQAWHTVLEKSEARLSELQAASGQAEGEETT